MEEVIKCQVTALFYEAGTSGMDYTIAYGDSLCESGTSEAGEEIKLQINHAN